MLWSVPWLPRQLTMRPYIATAVVGLALIASGFFVLQNSPVQAAGNCNGSSAALTGEEHSLVTQIASWRAANFPSAMPVESSATLDAAAAHYAEYLAANIQAQGHYAEPAYSSSSYPWVPRAIDCGWPSAWGAGGEGLAVVTASFLPSVSASQALAIMVDTSGGTHYGGLWHPSNNARCVGVGHASSPSNNKVAWVALLFQYSSSAACPQATTVVPGTTTTPLPTASATSTSTPTPTATLTASPTPATITVPKANYGMSVLILKGWNLVTLPRGPIQDILDTAADCYTSVYTAFGDSWRRYSPQLPAYAQNLVMSEGQAFWIAGRANCGFIEI